MEWITVNRLLKLLNKDRVLSVRFLIVLLVIIYIPIALYMNFVYSRTIDAVEKEKKEDIEQILRKTSQSINFTLSSVEKGAFEIATHNGIQVGIQNFEDFTYDIKNRISTFTKDQFMILKDDIPYIEGFAYITKNGQIVSADKDIEIDSKKFFESDDFKILISGRQSIIWNYGASEYLYYQSKEEKVLFLVYRIADLEDVKDVGYFFVTINPDRFKAFYEDTFIGNTGGVVIYDENNNPVLSRKAYNVSEIVFQSKQEKEFYKINDTIISDEQYFLGVAPLFPKDWFLVAIVPKNELTKTVKDNLKNNFTPIIIMSIITALLIVIETLVVSKVVTEKEMANYRLVLSQKMNEKLRIYKHDFTNHLQIIWGLLELEHYDKALNYLIKASNEGATIKEKYEIGIPEIESTIFSFLSKAREQDIEVEMDCMKLECNLPVKIYDLTKILTNLLKNAMYALDKSEDDDKKLTIRIYEELGDYVFEVINNVPVIPEDLRERIFEKGFTTKGKAGSGLGLHIVKRLVEKNKGDIELKVDEEGNHFIVRFPC